MNELPYTCSKCHRRTASIISHPAWGVRELCGECYSPLWNLQANLLALGIAEANEPRRTW